MRSSTALSVLAFCTIVGCSQHEASSTLPAAAGTAFAPDVPAAGGFASLYSFKGGSDGVQPFAGVIAVNGTLYGTTFYGGKNGDGIVFKIAP